MTIQVQLDAGRSILQTAAQFSDPSRAIWEYVVNSLENRESPSNCIINISIKNTNKTICISDNSNGMDLEELTNFWVVSKDNRKFNKKKGNWIKRGMFGTGKLSAFGIGNELIVETVKNGIKNSTQLDRQTLQKAKSNDIKTKTIFYQEKVNEKNGTKIFINDLNIKIKQEDIIKYIERHTAHLRNQGIKIAVNSSVCQFKPLDITNTYIFPSEGAVKERYGEFEFKVEVSRSPLEKFEMGAQIFSDNDLIGQETCGVSEKEYGNLIKGEVDILGLKEPIDNIQPFDQTRSLVLNKEHKGVMELIIFLGQKLEKVRKEESERRKIQKETSNSQRMSKITDDLTNKLSNHWEKIQKTLNEVRLGTNQNIETIFSEIGEDQNIEALMSGEEISSQENELLRVGENIENISPVSDPQKSLEKSDEGALNSKKTTGKSSKRKGSAFKVDHQPLGAEHDRSRYNKEELTILVNTDHPTVKACLKSCNEDVEHANFQRIIYEIAFREFEHAVAQEKIDQDENIEAFDLLYEMNIIYEALFRDLGKELYY